MLRVAAEQLQSMRQQVDDRFERLNCAGGAARQVKDHRLSSHSANCPAERRKWSFLCTLRPHSFGHAFEQTLADAASGFGSNVTGGHARAARGYYQTRAVNPGENRLLNGRLLVWDGGGSDDCEFVFFEDLSDRWPGNIGALAVKTGITDGDDGCAQLRSRGGHRLPPPQPSRRRVETRRAAAGPPLTSLEY